MPQLGAQVQDPATLAALNGSAPPADDLAPQPEAQPAALPSGAPQSGFIPPPVKPEDRKHQYTPDQMKERGLSPKFMWGYTEAAPDFPIKIGDAAPAPPDIGGALGKLQSAILAAKKAKYLSDNHSMATGLGYGIVGKHLPIGAEMDGYVTTMKANEAFTQLMDMIQNNPSPTHGNPLGRTSEGEVKLLGATNYQFDPYAGSGPFSKNLDRFINTYSKMYAKLGGDPNGIDVGSDYGESAATKAATQKDFAATLAPYQPPPPGGTTPPAAGTTQPGTKTPPVAGATTPPAANKPAIGDIDFSGEINKRPAKSEEFQQALDAQIQSGAIRNTQDLTNAADAFNKANGTQFSFEAPVLKAAGQQFDKGERPSIGTPTFKRPKEQDADTAKRVKEGGATAAAIVGAEQVIPGANVLSAFGQTAFGDRTGGFGENFRANRSALDYAAGQYQEAHPYAYGAGELGGSLLLPGFAEAKTPAALAKLGMIYGGLTAAGKSQSLAEIPANLLTGAATGAATAAVGGKAAELVGKVGGKAVDALTARGERKAADLAAAQSTKGFGPQEIGQAFQDEGIGAPEIMGIPDKRVKAGALQTTAGGGATVDKGFEDVRQGLANRAGQIATGDAAPSAEAAGEVVQKAGKRRFDALKRLARSDYYKKAEGLAGGISFVPRNIIDSLDSRIADLSANPNSNKSVLQYLKDVRGDFVDTVTDPDTGKSIEVPIRKTIQQVRDVRENFGDEINARNLGTTKAERYMLDAMGGASKDINTALAKNPEAAAAYNKGDAIWKRAYDDKRQIIEGLRGPENNMLSGTAAMDKVRGWLGKDSQRFTRVMDMLNPTEKANFGATLFDNIGRESPDAPFSPAHFLSQTKPMGQEQLRTLFGDEAAKSIQNLRVASQGFKAAAKKLNVSGSTTTAGRQGLFSTVIGGLLSSGAGLAGALHGGAGEGIGAFMAGATVSAATQLAKRAADKISARSLMNPDVGRWMVQASKASTPRDYAKAMQALTTIGKQAAKTDSAMAGEISELRQRLSDAINEQVGAKKLPVSAAR